MRDAYVHWLRQALTDDRPVLIIRGNAGSGKTRLVTQFVDRDPSRVISYFVGDDVFTSSPERFLWDMCAQLSPLLRQADLPNDVSPSQLEGLLATMLGQLSAAARRDGQPYYLAIDGVDRAVTTGLGKSFADLARIGRTNHIHVLLTSTTDPRLALGIREAETRDIQLFSHSDTEAYLKQFTLSEADVMRLHEASGGVPVYLDAIRRQLDRGADIASTIEQLPNSLRDLFEGIWERAELEPDDQELLAFIAFSGEPLNVESTSSLSGVEPSVVKELVDRLEFLEFDRGSRIGWITTAFAEFASAKLQVRRAAVELALLDYYEKQPESYESQTLVPALLARRGNYEGLRRLVQSAALSRALNVTKSIPQVQRNLVLAAEEAVANGDIGTLTSLATAIGILDATMSSFAAVGWQIEALAALGRWDDARNLASELVLPEDRIRGFAAILSALRAKSLPPDTGIESTLEVLVDQLGAHTPEHAAQVATPLFDLRPDLALKIVKNSAGDAGPRALERALTILGIGAAVRGSDLENVSLAEPGGAWHRVSDLSLVRTSEISAEEVLELAADDAEPASQLFLLRMWCNQNRKRQDAHLVVATAFDILTASGDYGAPIRSLRQLAEPLRTMPAEQAEPLATRLRLLVDGANQSPQIELLRVRLILCETAAQWDIEYARAQLAELAQMALAIPDLDIRAEALSHVLAPASSGPLRDRALDETLSEALDAAFEGLLADSADHYRATIRALRALARVDLSRALSVALRLNTSDRRDRALRQLVAQSVGGDQRGDLDTLMVVAQEIEDTLEHRPAALRRICEWVAKRADANLAQIEDLFRLTTELPDPHDRATLAALISRAVRDRQAERAEALTAGALADLDAIDDPWRRSAAAADVVRLLADWDSVAAERAYQHVDPAARTAAADPTFGPLLAEAIETAIVGFHASPDRPSFKRLVALIDLLPAPSVQVDLLSELGLRCEATGLGPESREVGELIGPLLNSVSDAYALAICSSAAAQFMAVRGDPALDGFLDRVPYPASDTARLMAALHVATGAMLDVGFDFDASMPPVSFDRAHRALLLARSIVSDSTYYTLTRVVADGVSAYSNRFSRAQTLVLADEISARADDRPPDRRGIKHSGYRILLRAEAARIRHSLLPRGRKDWSASLAEARVVPNVADRSFVMSRIARYMWADDRASARTLADDALALIPAIPNVIDRIERIEEAASALFAFRSLKDASAVLASGVPLVQNLELTIDSEPIVESFVDLVDRIDPELAGSLTTEIEEKARIVTIRERSIAHDLRRNPGAASRIRDEDPESAPRRLATAADLLIQALAAGQVGATSQNVVLQWLRDVMPGHWHYNVAVVRWASENARVGKWPEATRSAIRDGLVDSAEFAALVGQVVRSLGEFVPAIDLVVPGSTMVRAGAREEGLKLMADWTRALVPSLVQLVDPYFAPDDLRTLSTIAPDCELRIYSGNRLNPGAPIRTAKELLDEALEEWRANRFDPPPTITVVVMGTAGGKCPFHDRFLLTDSGGIEIGTSLSGIGSRDSRLSKIGSDIVAIERSRLGEWMLKGVPLLDDEPVSITTASNGT